MRTLYFVERFWPLIGGVEVLSFHLMPLLAARGHEITVVTDQELGWLPQDEMYGPVRIRRIPFVQALRDRDLELLVRARRAITAIVEEHVPELLHATFCGAGVMMLRPILDCAPMILSMHGSWESVDLGAEGGLFARLFDGAEWITACSENAMRDLLAAVPRVEGRTSVILNGLDPAFEGSPPEPPSGPPVLFCSGRIVYDKGLDVAIDALAHLLPKHPGLRLMIAGDGPELDSLARRAEARSLADQVEFTGWVSPDRVHELAQQASIVVIPSRLEGFGLVALEAALMARPVVAAAVGGLPEVVENGVTGLLVPGDDALATAQAIDRLLRDPAQARAMGAAGRRGALEHFNARRHADDWDSLYRRIGATREGAVL